MKGFKKMLFGEKMPDKQDPKYKERYERDVAAGRKFAKTLRIDKAAAKVQKFADIHRTLFLVIVFSFVAFIFGFNIFRIVKVYNRGEERRTATELQDSLLKARHDRLVSPIQKSLLVKPCRHYKERQQGKQQYNRTKTENHINFYF